MKTNYVNFWGTSRWWWVLLIVGILLVIEGFAYWLFPTIGYTVVSMLFGWMLIIMGVVQLCVSMNINRPKGWGWWLVGGILDIFLGFMLVRSIVLSEVILPYFFAAVFFFWGLNMFVGAIIARHSRYWWLNLINGVILLIISYCFIESGFLQDVMMISLLSSIGFIYWGFSVMIIANDMRPEK